MTSVPFPREAYYERIGATTTLLPLVTANTSTTPGALGVNFLRNLVLAHLSTIPFENVDVLLGRPISTNLADLYNKLIHARRGGYCIEQNSLLRAAMVDAGFTHIRTLGGRSVIPDEAVATGRLHVMNLVTIHGEEGEEERWVVDVGTSAGVPMGPLRLDTTASQFTPAGEFRISKYDLCTNKEMMHYARPVGGFDEGWTEYAFEMHAHSGTWRAIHRFDLQPQYPRDVFAMNYVTYQLAVIGYSLRGSRTVTTWAPEGTQGIPNGVGGWVCVPRGVHGLRVETESRVSVRTLNAYPGAPDAAPPTGELAPPVPHEEHPTTPGELYDWMVEYLGIDFTQTRLPQYNVSREEFEKALRARVVLFGGKEWEPPVY
ncbi:N-hydroxyarylamine O-acetyltransferase [Leptomonas pyrrhocoris]|uniref:N-hydroxyarylamine O-acetyltransferase n=1 Tax=Leptomonas pyrrhocoris TaxID=157538 RepID=A0A0N0DTN0_LEPPY|nr:N-hydroxyarylamine O-acetyltransferase [Leptomonas pyrrhocoris]XP_015656100.1 N-hydroxyarylamine O-acetyltransferase [Leptomonas pyrrhocoris]XP_015656101.1 N-hydroxyarylamine O-acetyltransferase [Leptomonas pyrrhocoris]KPA77660.1 N-hydroxyarylamine O-acetyltransferase [Leptomonas pyrrhocoris]KPA77661.1 N-hydroxyarylamine O-acetyltransferase [Leptomonas pyrrhocoris]KPA77662.1 N-hydroxyarylamine O-acetyltransferase [Leptomonas pyrrhocoris]|eukprot:XP_015656099.1 N-hydroxyarylamine O-acetyltransferase [Leptomonas pyrrhocoris]